MRRELRGSNQLGYDSRTGMFLVGTPGEGAFDFLPRARREYTALEVSAEGSTGRHAWRASYVWSRNWGNYPGLFDAITQLGLTEIGAVDVTNDLAELGSFNRHLLGAAAVHPASEHIPVARANGVTHAVAAPAARPGGIGGQGSLINLDGWTVEEMLVAPSVGMMVQWPGLQTREFDFTTFWLTMSSPPEAAWSSPLISGKSACSFRKIPLTSLAGRGG